MKDTAKEKRTFKRIVALFLAALILAAAGDFIYSRGGGEWLASVFGGSTIAEATTEHGRELILVNSESRIPDDYEVELITLSNGERVDKKIYPSLQIMFNDMRSQGLYPTVKSGYRSEESQREILDEKYEAFLEEGFSKKEAEKLSRQWVAFPGTSEHQLGLAVDINPDREKSGDEVYEWLEENAHKYGFVKRYPEDKTEITGISNEPWHFRYVGREAAEEMMVKDLCLEEYIALLE